ncbi:MAG TPA: glycosyltransferase, partial [Burkholderiales bacterium]|nr:glycosyltransferase [Burkholderiales bacterium]
MKRPAVLVVGPLFDHALAARLAGRFEMLEFVGGPPALAVALLHTGAALVHLHGAARPLACAAAAKLCGAALLCQVEDAPPPAHRSVLAALVDAFVVPSAAQADEYREALPRGLVVQISPGIDCAPFRRINRAPFSADTPLRLVHLGRLERDAGLPEMIEALRLVREQGIAARLVLAGSGPEEPRLRHQIADAALSRDVVFAGDVEGEQRARLLSQSDVLLLPAYRAGVPRELLEAMAAGVVPVASAVGGIPEVVVAREHGALAEPRDARAIAAALARLAGD